MLVPGSLEAGNQRQGFRSVQLSLHTNHRHLSCEASGPAGGVVWPWWSRAGSPERGAGGARARSSGEERPGDLAVDVGEAEVAALVAVGQAGVVEA